MRGRNRLPGLHQCLMDIVDKFREVGRRYGIVADMGADDLDCQRALFLRPYPCPSEAYLEEGQQDPASAMAGKLSLAGWFLLWNMVVGWQLHFNAV